MFHTRQIAIEGLLPCVTSHVSFEGISTGVWHALSGASIPFAGVLLLSAFDMVVVDMLDQSVHVA